MELSLAIDLANRLRAACPVRSGALQLSISRVQGNSREYIITIGNESGKETNGHCATVQYAAITNYNESLYYKKKNGEIVTYKNPNYHWVNKAVEDWVRANRYNFKIMEDDSYANL